MKHLLFISYCLWVLQTACGEPEQPYVTCEDQGQFVCQRAAECGIEIPDVRECEAFETALCDGWPAPCQKQPEDYTCEEMHEGIWWHCHQEE